MTIELSRAEQRNRRAKAKALYRALRSCDAGSGWRTVSGSLFRSHFGWFVEVGSAVWLPTHRTVCRLHLKPMGVDPIFWEIVLLPENNQLPLSFRANGAWTCTTPPFVEYQADDLLSVDQLAHSILAWSTEQLAAIELLRAKNYIEFLRESPRGYPGAYLAAEVTTLILFDRKRDALDICEAAQSRGDHGGYTFADADGEPANFVGRAIEYLRAQFEDQTNH